MENSIHAIVRNGRIKLIDSVNLPEGTNVTQLLEDAEFWWKVSESSLAKIWDNTEDDVYAELLKK